MSPCIVRAFEHFYDGIEGKQALAAERRLRDMFLEHCKSANVSISPIDRELLSDMHFYFKLLEACQEAGSGTKEPWNEKRTE